uniref:Uncharacterized protein n=1 Tax=Rhizophora mucronata TaxID=61149 RepID=A0A2P2IH65_RHIMU
MAINSFSLNFVTCSSQLSSFLATLFIICLCISKIRK